MVARAAIVGAKKISMLAAKTNDFYRKPPSEKLVVTKKKLHSNGSIFSQAEKKVEETHLGENVIESVGPGKSCKSKRGSTGTSAHF